MSSPDETPMHLLLAGLPKADTIRYHNYRAFAEQLPRNPNDAFHLLCLFDIAQLLAIRLAQHPLRELATPTGSNTKTFDKLIVRHLAGREAPQMEYFGIQGPLTTLPPAALEAYCGYLQDHNLPDDPIAQAVILSVGLLVDQLLRLVGVSQQFWVAPRFTNAAIQLVTQYWEEELGWSIEVDRDDHIMTAH